MNITRPIFTVLSSAILFLSCTKSSGLSNAEGGYYIKFKIKNEWVLWRVVASDIDDDPDNESVSDLVIAGQADDNSAALQLRIQMDGPITAGEYSSDERHMPILYLKLAPEFQSYALGSSTGMSNSKYVITISSITDSTVSGRFTGNYLENKLVPDDVVEITEGQFNMLRTR